MPQGRGQELLRLDELGEDNDLFLRMVGEDSVERGQQGQRLRVPDLPEPLDQVLELLDLQQQAAGIDGCVLRARSAPASISSASRSSSRWLSLGGLAWPRQRPSSCALSFAMRRRKLCRTAYELLASIFW